MSSTIDTELGNIETKLNDDNIRVDALEKGVNELNGRNTNVNNESVRTTVLPLNERKNDKSHVTNFKDFKYLTEKFSNPSPGGGKKTRKNKRRRTKKNSKCHKKRRSLKKRH